MTLRLHGWLKKLVDILVDGEYHIAYRTTTGRTLMEKTVAMEHGQRQRFRQLRPTWREWYADPIIYTQGKKTYVFMEVYDRLDCRGCIGVSELDDGGRLTRPVRIIEEPFHMSFPMVFDYDGRTYMIPETIEGGALFIYRMEESVYQWKQVRRLEELAGCVDSVVYSDDQSGDINIFTCKSNEENGLLTGLRRYVLEGGIDGECKDRSETLNEGYRQYRYDMRNGGPLIRLDGELYRVIQKSTEYIYGESIELRRALIGANAYTEEYAGSISLDDIAVTTLPLTTHRVGIHTYGCGGGIEITDVSVVRASLANTARKLVINVKNRNKRH